LCPKLTETEKKAEKPTETYEKPLPQDQKIFQNLKRLQKPLIFIVSFIWKSKRFYNQLLVYCTSKS